MGSSQKFSVDVTPEKRAGEQSIHVLDKSNNIPCVESIRAWAVSRQIMSLMKSLLGIVLLLLPVIFAKEGRLRADASEMLSVEYGVDPSGIRYADQISVNMADGPKDSLQLFEEGCKRITAINVQYKGENETEWQDGGTKRHSHTLKDLDPCQVYMVRVGVQGEHVKDFEVGPYYEAEMGTETSLCEEQNPHFVATKGKIHRAKTGTTSTLVELEAPICAKTVSITILQEGADPIEEIKKPLNNDPISEEVQEVNFDDLYSCSEYRMMVDLFLNKEDHQQLETYSGDFSYDETFYTLPDPLQLRDHFTFDNSSLKLSWNFTKFFEQPCSKANDLTPDVAVIGEKQLDADIDMINCSTNVFEVTFGEEQKLQLGAGGAAGVTTSHVQVAVLSLGFMVAHGL